MNETLKPCPTCGFVRRLARYEASIGVNRCDRCHANMDSYSRTVRYTSTQQVVKCLIDYFHAVPYGQWELFLLGQMSLQEIESVELIIEEIYFSGLKKFLEDMNGKHIEPTDIDNRHYFEFLSGKICGFRVSEVKK